MRRNVSDVYKKNNRYKARQNKKTLKFGSVEEVGGGSNCKNTKRLKKQKNRDERRIAKVDPDCVPGYGKYRGYQT